MFSLKELSVVLLFAFTTGSCERIDKEPEGSAGKGGSATLDVVSKHHGNNISDVTVYIKYNTSDASSVYDDSTVAVTNVDGTPVATFGNLKNGNYYLFGKGWDPTISAEVIGGIPFTISEQRIFSINLPVTEGD